MARRCAQLWCQDTHTPPHAVKMLLLIFILLLLFIRPIFFLPAMYGTTSPQPPSFFLHAHFTYHFFLGIFLFQALAVCPCDCTVSNAMSATLLTYVFLLIFIILTPENI